jgi:hypothetical protein
MICLESVGYVRRICCCDVHLKCQRMWSTYCLICKENTGIRTRNEYVYHEPNEPPQVTALQLLEQIRLMREFIEEREQEEIREIMEEQ